MKINIKDFNSAISQIAQEKGLSEERILETIEIALAAAYKKDYGKKGQIIRAKLDTQTNKVDFRQIKLAVDKSTIFSDEEIEELREKRNREEPVVVKERKLPKTEESPRKVRFNPERHIMIEEAKKIEPKIKVGEELVIPLGEKEEYGRIAAQTAKQVVLQKIREAERENIFKEYRSKEGEIVSGLVQRIERGTVFLDVGKTLAILPREEQVRGEFYKRGQRIKVYITKVEESPRGPLIFLSRAYPKLISKLFELEVPEISSGQVVIKSIAREAGSRSKVATFSTAEGVDPIGAMVGQRGTRIAAVISELGGEKIDIIEYSDDPEKYIANALSPAKTLEIRILPKNKALAVVPSDQLSLAIGKGGQNVRLAAKLTGWKIDVKSPEKLEQEEGEEKEEEKVGEEKKEKPVSADPSTKTVESHNKATVNEKATTSKGKEQAEEENKAEELKKGKSVADLPTKKKKIKKVPKKKKKEKK